MILSPDQNEKIELLDIILNSYSIDDLRAMVGADATVEKLKGTLPQHKIIRGILTEVTVSESRIATLSAEVSVLRSDLVSLLRIISQMQTPIYIPELANLKSRFSV